ncbi:MAG: V-type ATP synthase subunit D [Brevinema sp.]
MKNITPTKSNYTILAEELSLAKEGHGLLEQKREVLVMNLANLAAEIKDKRSEMDHQLSQIFSLVSLVRLENGSVGLNLICNSVAQDYEVELLDYSVMGVEVPKLIFLERQTRNKSQVPIGISGTSPNFDKLLQMTKQLRSLMAEVAYLESTAWKLVTEIKKTQRRINALENFVIPEAQETMKFIKDTLEEKDRETLFQIKRIKEKQQKKQTLKKEGSYDM